MGVFVPVGEREGVGVWEGVGEGVGEAVKEGVGEGAMLSLAPGD